LLAACITLVLGEGFSGRDLVLLGGGVFLLYKASREIFTEVEAREEQAQQRASMESRRAKAQFWAVIGQIALIDIEKRRPLQAV
jgi:predicted tellurium resistance membrane protein TerC